MEAIAKSIGWRKWRGYNWCCPECLEELKAGQVEVGHRSQIWK
jgi:hypothetical protein